MIVSPLINCFDLVISNADEVIIHGYLGTVGASGSVQTFAFV